MILVRTLRAPCRISRFLTALDWLYAESGKPKSFPGSRQRLSVTFRPSLRCWPRRHLSVLEPVFGHLRPPWHILRCTFSLESRGKDVTKPGPTAAGSEFFSCFAVSPYFSGTCSHSDGYHLTRRVLCEVFHSYKYCLRENLSEGVAKDDRCRLLQRSPRVEFGGFAWQCTEQIIPEPVE